MTAPILIRTPLGWCFQLGTSTLDVESGYVDRGNVRAVLTARDAGSVRFRDKVNLTSALSREKIIRKLSEVGMEVTDAVLLAFEEAWRSVRAVRPTKERCVEAPDFSGTAPPLDLPGLEAVFSEWLLIEDAAYLPVFVGAVLAHRLDSDPAWLLTVAPPGATKTEALRALYGYPGMFPLSDLSSKTLASGLDVPGEDPSLLSRLRDEVLVLKDLTTVLTKHADERQAIFGQLREIYDGRFDRYWGSGRELHWTGRLGLVGGVTPAIDSHHAALSVLGERFVLLRPAVPDRQEMARWAMATRGKEREMREALAKAMHGFLAARGTVAPVVGEDLLSQLASIADFTTRARSGVARHGQSRDLEYPPEPEAPTRFAKVLLSLACGIGLAYDSPHVGERELQLVTRVAIDSLPILRRNVLLALLDAWPAAGLPLADLAKRLRMPSRTNVRRCLEDLHALGAVTRRDAKSGLAEAWELDGRWSAVLTRIAEAIPSERRILRPAEAPQTDAKAAG